MSRKRARAVATITARVGRRRRKRAWAIHNFINSIASACVSAWPPCAAAEAAAALAAAVVALDVVFFFAILGALVCGNDGVS